MIDTTGQEYLANHRSKDSFGYSHEVTKIWGGLDDMIAWCKTELSGEWRWQLLEVSNDTRPGRYIFYFDSSRDYTAFALKWC